MPEHKDLNILNDPNSLYKTFLKSYVNNNDYIIYKAEKPQKYSLYYDIISLNKHNNKAIDNQFYSVKSVIKNNNNFFDFSTLLCERKVHDLLCNNIFEFIYKKQVDISLFNKNIFINKTKANINLYNQVFIKAKHKDIFIQNQYFIKAISKNIFIKDNIFAYRKHKDINIINNIFAYRKHKNIFIKENDFAYKLNKYLDIFKQQGWGYFTRDIFYYNQPDNLLSTIRDIYLNQDDLAYKKFKDLNKFNNIDELNRYYYILNLLSQEQISREIKDFNYDNNIFLIRKDRILDLIPDAESIEQSIKEASLLTKPNLDWAWTYDEDEFFNDLFRIDELLLPETDTRYEDFENIIFDKTTGEPRNPVQEIDKYHFIAKYPVKYPIKEEDGTNAYKDLALEYLDVRTNIMKKVFLGYYQIWQDNMFSFGQMTMTQSAKKMLDYLYAWIMLYFPQEDIPEALRVLRQIRWYLESCIIENADYYITWTPNDLTSGLLNSNEFNIPSSLKNKTNIDGSENNTMIIDTVNHIIKQNPDYINQDTSIEFYIENYQETTISFSLHTSGNVKIYLNNNLLDNISVPTNGRMLYNIPYTEDINVFKIIRYASDNIDNDFFIGNVIIKNMGTDGDLDIDFKEKPTEGNKVLNKVSKKVLAYVNLYEDNQEVIKQLLNKNIAISDGYNKIMEYWNIHHEGKWKGKRLTIKKS